MQTNGNDVNYKVIVALVNHNSIILSFHLIILKFTFSAVMYNSYIENICTPNLKIQIERVVVLSLYQKRRLCKTSSLVSSTSDSHMRAIYYVTNIIS